MKSLTSIEADVLAAKFRTENGMTLNEPVHIKTVLRRLNILTLYRPLDDNSCGISLRSDSDKRFILINSNHSRGRQHFTVAHELYHLFYDTEPHPHLCKENSGGKNTNEYNADMFAAALLMPYGGLSARIPADEIQKGITAATVLRLEQYFQVSRSALLIRLLRLQIVSKSLYDTLAQLPKKTLANDYGYDTSLYEKGNEGIVIGDYGEKARTLFDTGKISEGHYNELLNLIRNENED